MSSIQATEFTPGVEVADKQIKIGADSFDVSANLFDSSGKCRRRILVPIKTRETEGGGHSHLFSRDVESAISVAKSASSDDYLVIIDIIGNKLVREKLFTIRCSLFVFIQ